MKPSTPKTELLPPTPLRKAAFGAAPKNAVLLLFSVAVLMAGGAAAVRGQSALDGFDPNANNLVLAVVVQPDGKILIGGAFSTLSPNGGAAVTRNRIARLNPDGTLDTSFNPNANGSVRSIAVQTDGKILAGGDFTSIGGQPRTNIARLNPDGTLDTTFTANANGSVRSIAVQTDGKILAGGQFTSMGGQARNRIARLDPTTGAVDLTFNPNANSTVFAIALQTDGKILVGGFFNGANGIGGQTRNRLARLDATGAVDLTFNPNASGGVFAIALQADGKILAGGDFNGANSIGGAARNRIARLDPTTGAADSFNPNANLGVFTIAVQADGKILAGGDFTTIGGQTRSRIARLDAATGPADLFDPNASANASIYSIALQTDGKILVGGNFTTLAPNGGTAVTRNRIARLETDGSLDQTLDVAVTGAPNTVPVVLATAIQPDGKILIGGLFTNVAGVVRNNIARVNPNGTLDLGFNPNADNRVVTIVVRADGKILVGGEFENIGGQLRRHIARLDPATGQADSFNPDANGAVAAIAVQPDGKILVGGFFNGFDSIGGQARNGIARLDPITGLADSFDPNADSGVNCMTLQTDGRILVGGNFSGAASIGGQTRNYIARLDPTTGSADSFDPGATGPVYAIALPPDGKVLAGGFFAGIGGQARDRIARLDPTTGLADSFAPDATDAVWSIAPQADSRILVGGYFGTIGGQSRDRIARLDPVSGLADSFDPDANSSVFAIMLQSDGKVLAGGSFIGPNSIGGQTRNRFARLSNNIAALQNLSVTRTAITWTRAGSSPHLLRATFEYSTDNVNYTLLGHGTASGADWSLTGLSLPVAQNIYIRARGYYRGGHLTSSESITESVRNVFIVPQPLLNIQRSGTANVVLSWATSFTDFTLESNTNLNANVWSVVSPAPVVSGANNVVTNAVSGSTRFYRLRK